MSGITSGTNVFHQQQYVLYLDCSGIANCERCMADGQCSVSSNNMVLNAASDACEGDYEGF